MIQVCSNEGPHSFPRGDNYEIVKRQSQNFIKMYSRTTEPILFKLGTEHPWVLGLQRKGLTLLKKKDKL